MNTENIYPEQEEAFTDEPGWHTYTAQDAAAEEAAQQPAGQAYAHYDTDRAPQAAQPAPRKKRTALWVALGVLACALCLWGVLGVGRRSLASLGDTRSAGTVQETESAQEAAEETTAGGNEETTSSRKLASPQAMTVVTDVTNVVDKAMPSIVSVYNNQVQEVNWFGTTFTQENQSAGSGIIIEQTDSELLIVTNHHVVAGEDSLEVQFIDDESAAAALKGSDADSDLAVISVKLADIPKDTLEAITVAEIGDSDSLKIGEPAIAIGNALGYGQSVTAGVISALNREIAMRDGAGGTYIQTDAAINQGNSGGALLNIHGQVVGINSNKIGGMTVEGMGFAIPISKALPIIEELVTLETREVVEEAERGTLGIQGVSVTADIAKAYNMPKGAYVVERIEGGAAAGSELRKGDIITAVDGASISTMEDLKKRLTYYRAGEEVKLTVARLNEEGSYEESEVALTLGDREVLAKEDPAASGEEPREGADNRPEEPQMQAPSDPRENGNGWSNGFPFPWPFGF